jgi:threonyl-tRNA synthetase
VLIEHYAGAFPTWLAPVQVKIISVGKAHIKHCHRLAQKFKDSGLRV